MTEHKDGFQEIDESPAVDGAMILSPAVRAEIDIQISTAKHYPRSIKAFKQQALDMATFDEETAAGCFYSLPRGGKPIEGPSARLAEIVVSAWGNVRADARIVGADGKEITAEAMTWDLEKNVAIRVQVKRRITDKYGKRFSADMVTVTGNAACSIALRNSVFKVIPMVYTKSIYHAARQVAIGDISTLEAKRSEAVAYFGKMGIVPERVFAAIGRTSIEDVGLDDVALLKGIATALKENEISIDEAFPPINGKADKPKGPDLITEDQRTALATAAQKSGAALGQILADAGFEIMANITVDKYDAILKLAGKKPVRKSASENALKEAADRLSQDEVQPDHVDPSITADEPLDTDDPEMSDEPKSEESIVADLQTAISDRAQEIGIDKYEDLLNGRRTVSMDRKALEAFLKELNK